jgi:hypothetical protein
MTSGSLAYRWLFWRCELSGDVNKVIRDESLAGTRAA